MNFSMHAAQSSGEDSLASLPLFSQKYTSENMENTANIQCLSTTQYTGLKHNQTLHSPSKVAHSLHSVSQTIYALHSPSRVEKKQYQAKTAKM